MSAFATYIPSPSLDERIEEIDTIDEMADVNPHPEVTDKIRSYFLTASAIIEDHSAKLIYKNVIDDSYQSHDILDELDKFSQARREQILFKSDLIDGELLNKMQEFRGVRNEIVHNYGQPMEWEDLRDDAVRGKQIFNAIYQKF